tara:strand:+ start:56 stop:991 length:936 start_codon:yes stop_codon:yes gene_type:complete
LSKYKFNKEVTQLLKDLKAAGGLKIEDLSPIEARNINLMDMPTPEVELVVEIGADGPFGPIQMYNYTPKGVSKDKPLPTIVYYHGGGWVIGSRVGSDALCRYLANKSGCRVFSVEYRLAPEFKFPVAPEECFEALKFINDNHKDLLVDKDKIAVAGDSAGGNLAAVVALMARDDKQINLAYQLLIYPATDASMSYPSYEENAKGYVLEKGGMDWFYKHYLPDEESRKDWRASPILAENLENLPPTYLITVLADPLRDEGRAYGEKLKKCGNKVEHVEYEDTVHAFFSWPTALDSSKKAVDKASKAIKKALS